MEGAPLSSAQAPVGLEPPGWWAVLSDVFIGYFWALVVLALAAFGLVELGLLNWRVGTVYPSGLLPGPFQPYGAWALAANASIAFTVLAVTAGLVVGSLRERLGQRPSFLLVFLALAATGYAPFFFFTGRLQLSGVIGLLLSAVLIRLLALPGRLPADLLADARSRLGLEPAWRRRLTFLAAAGWAALIGIVVGYGLLHPIRSYRTDFGGDGQRTIDGQRYEIAKVRPGGRFTTSIALQNGGFADLRVTSVEAGPGSTVALSSYSIGSEPWSSPTAADRLATATVPGRQERYLTIAVAAPSCRHERLARLPTIRVHYQLLGRAAGAVLPLKPALALRCVS